MATCFAKSMGSQLPCRGNKLLLKTPKSGRGIRLQKDCERTLQCRHAPVTCFCIRVEDSVFEVPHTFIEHVSPQMRKQMVQAPDRKGSRDDPFFMRGPTAAQFESLLGAFIQYPNLDMNRYPLEQILCISEQAHFFGISHLKTWSSQCMATLFIRTVNSPLRNAPNEVFLRAIGLAIAYHRPDIFAAIQVKWLTRILWHEVSPIPALLFAEKLGLLGFLGHAYYVHLMDLVRSGRLHHRPTFSPDLVDHLTNGQSPLQRHHTTHLLAGYYSLSTYWKSLSRLPIPVRKAPQCTQHQHCSAVWQARWAVTCSQPCSIPEVDILKRLQSVEEVLREDGVLLESLTPRCRMNALDSIAEQRTHVSNNLSHHFDL